MRLGFGTLVGLLDDVGRREPVPAIHVGFSELSEQCIHDGVLEADVFDFCAQDVSATQDLVLRVALLDEVCIRSDVRETCNLATTKKVNVALESLIVDFARVGDVDYRETIVRNSSSSFKELCSRLQQASFDAAQVEEGAADAESDHIF